MSWPYHFVSLDDDQLAARRELLDRYGTYSYISVVIPIIGYRLYRIILWFFSEPPKLRRDLSTTSQRRAANARNFRSPFFDPVRVRWSRLTWWLAGDVAPAWGWGLRGQWVATTCWVLWLGFLCVHKTGDDYLHLTKRIGQVAVAQIPLQYVLSMKSRNSPLAAAFSASHEELNPWHRLHGKVFYTFLLCHVTLYLNFFVQNGLLNKRINDRDVIIGFTAFSLLTILVSSALKTVRHWNYRLFFVSHILIAVTLPPLLYFHSTHLRMFVVQGLALYFIDVILDKSTSISGQAVITSVPDTNLIKVKISLNPVLMENYRELPGLHVYLSIPPRSTPAGTSFPSIHDLLSNPFTVAQASETHFTLVLRALGGPTSKALAELAKFPNGKHSVTFTDPLGGARYFPDIPLHYDRMLLVAGGVGSTFILPFYKSLRKKMWGERIDQQGRLTLVWSMRSAAEANWAIESKENITELEEDKNIEIYVSRSNAYGRIHPADESMELDEMTPKQCRVRATGGIGRPNLKGIVDEVFSHGNEEKVAILVCGPTTMARELRSHVGRWVHKGREVWFHNEAFGF